MATLFEYYNTGDDAYTVIYGINWYAQTFTPAITHTITSVKLLLFRINGFPGEIVVSIKATDISGHPSGNDLCAGTTNGNSLDTNYLGEWREISLGVGYNLIADTKYAIVLRVRFGDINNSIGWRKDTTSPTYNGGDYQQSFDSGASWGTGDTVDFLFEEWYTADVFIGRYSIQVDWDNNGDFVDTYDDITADVKSIHYSRGKSDELGKAEVGQLSITVNNDTGKYTPGFGGVISTLLLPKRPIRVRATYSGINYPLFYGFIEEIIPHPHLAEQDCIIMAVDGLDFLSRHDMGTALYKNLLTGTIHGYILDDARWSSVMRTIDSGQDIIPYWYGADVKARFAQGEIDDSEQGFSYVDGAGYFRFEDRYHRSTAKHQTSQGTFNNTMRNINYSLNPKNVYNIIKVKVTPWELKSEAELWKLQEIPSIPIDGTNTYWGESQYFVDEWVTPVPGASGDYTANSASTGAGDDETSNITITTAKFAKTIKLEVENNALHDIFLTLLKARGTYYDDQTQVTCKSEDIKSQTDYQKRTLEFDGKYMTNTDKAQNLAHYAKGKYKDPRVQLIMTLINQDDTTLSQILAREISDRITVVNTKLGVNGDYFIDYMDHDITNGGLLHTVTYLLTDCINEDFWCLDYSKLASSDLMGQTKLGY